MLIQNVFKEYSANFKVALAFGLLLVFVAAFSMLPNVFFGSGSIFLEYSFKELSLEAVAAPLAFSVLLLVFYSLLVSAIVFSVRRNLSKLKFHYYLSEMIQKFTAKIFLFFLVFSLVFFALATGLVNFGASIYLIAFILLVASLLLLFVPQAIVVDEERLENAVLSSYEFILKNPKSFVLVVVTGSILIALVQLLEFGVDLISPGLYLGRYVSLLLITVFVLPFIETMKTYLYMLYKSDLIKAPEMLRK